MPVVFAGHTRRLVVLAPLPWERRALLRALPGVRRSRASAVPAWSLVQAGREIVVLQVGMGQTAAADAFARVLAAGERGPFVCLGCAGALVPALAVGAGVIAEAVLYAGGTFSADEEGRQRLAAAATIARMATAQGVLLSVDEPLRTPLAKEQQRESGALAVDMESGALARQAATAGVPFAVGRVVLDTAQTRLAAGSGRAAGAVGDTVLALVEARLTRWLAALARLD